jgi:hypothetical protein
MPESVTDRPTKAHEYIFLLTKSQRYYWDQEAVKELSSDKRVGSVVQSSNDKIFSDVGSMKHSTRVGLTRERDYPSTRNIRTVWNIPTSPFKGAHFATWPEKLVGPMIKAGTSEKGCCPTCGKPWVRLVERESTGKRYSTGKSKEKNDAGLVTGSSGYDDGSSCPIFKTLGWRADCDCPEHEPIPCTVLDVFAGSGTTLLVARKLSRSGIGLDLSFAYLSEQATKRLELDKLKKWAGT